MEPHDRTHSLMQKGIQLQQQERYSEALAMFDEVIVIDPRRGESAYNSKGLTLKMAGRPEEAIACYELALDALCGKLFWALRNERDNPLYPWKKVPGQVWMSWTTKTGLYTSCHEQGIATVGWPTGESAAEEEKTKKNGGLLWVDVLEPSGVLRVFLPNYFHTMREQLKETKVFSRVLNNLGGAYLAMNKQQKGIERLYEAVAFIPEGDDYDDPYVALYKLQKNN